MGGTRNLQVSEWKRKKIFSVDTPPPTVSGKLHIGHVFSYTQAEMIARFKRMQGYDVFYPFGFDDNGLPTERLVEKDEKIHANMLSRSEFKSRCINTIEKYEGEFKDLWKRLGFSVDWDLQYQTISDLSQRISQKSFIELAKMNKAYMKESPVLWCTECQTSIAQAELESKECETTFNYLNFKTALGNLLIATTRPELLAGCVCIFVHPDDNRYKEYVGQKANVPLYDFEIPILTDDAVSMDKGTGVVMCATFGDSTDIEWYQKYNLQYKEIIMSNGTINESVLFVGGMRIKKAREHIIELLKEKELLVKQEKMNHMIAVHERCGNDVEFIPSKQWYIDVLTDKERFLQAADEINWHPEHMKNRYKIWVENLKWDWCISRQRYFGVPFPVWYCKDCNKPMFAEEEQLPVNPLESQPLHACSCGCNEFIPEEAVFDTWATSSVTTLINARYGEENDILDDIFPMGMRCQAHEIIRTWAFYSIVKSLYHTGKLPWKDIMISGFVLAKPGEKISKSKNNASNSPITLIETNSADAIRYWAANSKLGTDTFFSEEELKISKRFINKLYNAAKFAIMQMEDFEKPEKYNESDMLPIDRWILERVNETTIRVTNMLDNYEIGQARHEIDNLFWKDFCDYYIEIVKERLYQPDKHGIEERYSGQIALYHSLLGILKLYAIYTPYVTDYIYQEFYKEQEKESSLHQTVWSTKEINHIYIEFGEHIKDVIADVRKNKTENQMSMKDSIPELIIICPKKYKELYRKTEKDIKACTGAEKVMIRN
ncbi:valine--tRNA ligase [Anaerosporobacter sp.]|uniref:valine--tRNA ligase n=1 Tax=Anaerosporobacter sp. TaxID=1872529 RepID=UPI00286EEEB3|nr:valine--tRNA ligase [Anaerosporobacter sp.]